MTLENISCPISTLEWCWTGRANPMTAWLPVSLTHTHARLVCETHIADTIVSKSCVKLILFKKVAYRTQNVAQERLSITCESLMTQRADLISNCLKGLSADDNVM